MRKYSTIVADPPWPIVWSTGNTRLNGRGVRYVNRKKKLPYKTMSIADICKMGVYQLAEENAHLYLWTVDRFLMDGSAAKVARCWGFEPRRIFIWKKTAFGLGTFPRPQRESCLVAIRGRLPFALRNVGSVQTWKVVYEKDGKTAGRKHSAKPTEFFDLVQRASPGPYLELFSRNARAGWDSHGDEAPVDRRVSCP